MGTNILGWQPPGAELSEPLQEKYFFMAEQYGLERAEKVPFLTYILKIVFMIRIVQFSVRSKNHHSSNFVR